MVPLLCQRVSTSVFLISTRHPGCTPALSLGIWSAMSLWDRQLGCESHEGCVWCRMLDRSSPNNFKTKHQSSTLNKTKGQKSTKATEHCKAKRHSNQAIVCWGLRRAAWYHPFGWARFGRCVDHSLGHCISHRYEVFRTINQETQKLVWWEPCWDYGPHRGKSMLPRHFKEHP